MKADICSFGKQPNSLFVRRVFAVRERWCRVESSPLSSHAPRLARAHWAVRRETLRVFLQRSRGTPTRRNPGKVGHFKLSNTLRARVPRTALSLAVVKGGPLLRHFLQISSKI